MSADRKPFPVIGRAPAVRDYVRAYEELVAVAQGRARLYAELLADQVDGEVDPLAGLVGRRHGVDGNGRVFEAGEDVRALARLEAEERDRLARLTTDTMQAAVEAMRARRDDTHRGSLRASACTLRAFVEEIGLDLNRPEVQRAAQRAMLAGPRELGIDFGDPAEIGPPLDADEQARGCRERGSDQP